MSCVVLPKMNRAFLRELGMTYPPFSIVSTTTGGFPACTNRVTVTAVPLATITWQFFQVLAQTRDRVGMALEELGLTESMAGLL